ncbi:AroB-related putative sugar phosphate phospholyase (cyclizing) [Candidatus Neomarinimicrobiota bacterium]
MSDRFTVRSSIRDYEVIFADEFQVFLKEHLQPGDIALIDSNVFQLHQTALQPVLADRSYQLIEPSEEQKEYTALAPIIESLIQSGFRKNNRLIAIGGGIIQDITAFIASMMFRGVSWFFYPSTLLAQCDSCIGGKSSINFGRYKNQIGNFCPPNQIVIDLRFLDTLPERDLRSGLGEMMHFYYVSGQADIDLIENEYDRCLTDRRIIQRLIRRSLEIKKATIEIDEFDQAERLLFNYGHTFGHAIESLTNYAIPHGVAVCMGMDLANTISCKLGHITDDQYTAMRPLLRKNIGDMSPGSIDLGVYEDALRKDKKSIGTQVNVILTKGPGKMFKTPLNLTDEVRSWIADFFKSF